MLNKPRTARLEGAYGTTPLIKVTFGTEVPSIPPSSPRPLPPPPRAPPLGAGTGKCPSRASAPPAWTTTTRLPLALPMPRRLRRPPRVPRQCRPRVCQACARAGAGRAIITASCVCYSMFYEYMLRAHTSTRTSSARCALPPPSKCGRSPSQSLRFLVQRSAILPAR